MEYQSKCYFICAHSCTYIFQLADFNALACRLALASCTANKYELPFVQSRLLLVTFAQGQATKCAPRLLNFIIVTRWHFFLPLLEVIFGVFLCHSFRYSCPLADAVSVTCVRDLITTK